jgi:dUTP pyrophosphatase
MRKEYTLRVIGNTPDIENMYKNHTHYNKGDSGIDLFNVEDILIKKGECSKIKFGISCELLCQEVDNEGNKIGEEYNVSYLLIPRSSIIKTPLRMSNSIGLIDAHYQNNICAIVDNIKDEDYLVLKGTRLFQLVSPDLTPFNNLEVVKTFTKPEMNRKGGYGSTGK